MRALLGAGTPKEVASFTNAFVFVIHAADAIAIVVVAAFDAEIAVLILAIASRRCLIISVLHFVTGLLMALDRAVSLRSDLETGPLTPAAPSGQLANGR